MTSMRLAITASDCVVFDDGPKHCGGSGNAHASNTCDVVAERPLKSPLSHSYDGEKEEPREIVERCLAGDLKSELRNYGNCSGGRREDEKVRDIVISAP